MIPPEQKAKLEQMGVDYVRVAHTLKNDALSTRCRDSYKAGAKAAWDMAVQYATEKERLRIQHLLCSLGLWIYVNPIILNPPEQKEEGDRG